MGEGAPSVPALRDTLRSGGPASMSATLNNKHPLEARLEKWEETQFNMKMENYRRTLGAAEPIRRGMELAVVQATDAALPRAALGLGTSAHSDILMNRETSVSWEEVYPEFGANGAASDLGVLKTDIHAQMAKRMGL